MEQAELKQLTRTIRRRYFEYFNILYSSHLINLIILQSLSKSAKIRWHLNTRDIILLISASLLISKSRSRYFSASKLKSLFKNIFYSQEIHRSISKLIDNGVIIRIKRNSYKITMKGDIVIRSYTQQFNKEFYRLKDQLGSEAQSF